MNGFNRGESAYDRKTGLTWSRNANPIDRRQNWENALSAVKALDGPGTVDTRDDQVGEGVKPHEALFLWPVQAR